MTERLERLDTATTRLIEARDALIQATGGAELVDAYRDALAERLRASGQFWGHAWAVDKVVEDVVEWAAYEVGREIKTNRTKRNGP
ncbi:hypothetical protein [Streptomyces sp. NPDC015131]|uniref:hypothetical protein n=1 Tax=Streptomyces sp. NPDC015131 TaxID=3364941 RepID=UPI0036F943F7